jgi:CheY-like chemotaxis protein
MSIPIVGQRGLRILVVDDHEGSAQVLARLLSRDGHDVVTAGSAADALTEARWGRPVDLLLSDIGLPDVDGCELLRRLRSMYRRDVPAIAISGNGEQSDVETCRRAGYSQLLLKPIDFPELLAAVRGVQGCAAHAPRAAGFAARAAGTAV